MMEFLKPWIHLALNLSHDDVGLPLYILLCCCAGILGGLMVGTVLGFLEIFWYHTLLFFHRKNLIRRLAPAVDVTVNKYRKESFMAVSIAPIPLAILVFAARKRYVDSAFISLDLMGGWKFCWITMALHDAYYWAAHTVLHSFKSLYRRVHRLHHSTGGDITVFSTAYGDFLDVTVTITPFYAGLMLWLYGRAAWNVFYMVVLGWAVNGVNMMGHCGYRLPAWIYVPGSMGVLLTPLAQRPVHHLIHHLDPNSNRSLYFTWWDRLAGTFRDTHPKIKTC